MRKYFYIYDATTGEVYKRGLNRKQKRYFKKLSKKMGLWHKSRRSQRLSQCKRLHFSVDRFYENVFISYKIFKKYWHTYFFMV